jgi:hypothetical protein
MTYRPKDAIVTGHIRAGNLQHLDGTSADSANDFAVHSNLAENSSESVGPTGSGATNIWTALDNVPSNATALILDVYLLLRRSDADITELTFAGGSASLGNLRRLGIGAEWNDTGDILDEIVNSSQTLMPCDSNQTFLCRWNIIGTGGSADCKVLLRYNGFMTD